MVTAKDFGIELPLVDNNILFMEVVRVYNLRIRIPSFEYDIWREVDSIIDITDTSPQSTEQRKTMQSSIPIDDIRTCSYILMPQSFSKNFASMFLFCVA